MANTIMTAKNTFQDGLVMDFAPDSTQASVLTNALNATILTFNGNEYSLQNDMGNGRVETAYLPEGYTPVGTCEFGDIIYVVSYNPLTNKSQIGCFPSPERNISSEEMGDTPQTLSDSDFFTKKGSENWVRSNSAKKILCSKALNPGDKFIVYTTNEAQFEKSGNIITDYGNTAHTIYTYPKQLRISLVAIEDSGKINYLDSTLKWYEKTALVEPKHRDYYITSSYSAATQKVDIDSYRDLLNSGYSVFQSKVSGKLAILAELERISGFDCTYDVYKVDSNAEAKQKLTDYFKKDFTYNTYKIYINCSWDTENNDINPSSLRVHDIKWISNRNTEWAGKYQTLIAPNDTAQTLDLQGYKAYAHTDPSNIDITKHDKYHADNGENYEMFIKETSFDAITKDFTFKKVSQWRNLGIPVCGEYLLDVTSYQGIKQEDGTYSYKYYDSENKVVPAQEIDDITINNFYKSTFYKEIHETNFDVIIPDTQTVNGNTFNVDKQDLILQFTTTPKMEYGFLPDLSVINQIDFSKIGTGAINLNTYKYYIGENLCTLMLGTEIYPEENKGVEEIVLEFYDNQGICAAYHINDRQSYSGLMTEQIPLNGASTNYKLSSIDANGASIIHAGTEVTTSTTETTTSKKQVYTDENKQKPVFLKDKTKVCLSAEGSSSSTTTSAGNKEDLVYLDSNGKPNKNGTGQAYTNDAGTLYSNFLYAVKIIVKYKSKNILGQYDATDTKDYKYFWRWMWTNTMFNEYYTSVSDFKDIQAKLDLDVTADYQANFSSTSTDCGYGINTESTELYKGLGAKFEHLTGPVNYQVTMGLQNTYNTFTLIGNKADNTGAYKAAQVEVYLGNSYFTDGSSLVYYNNILMSDNNLLNVDLTNSWDTYYANYSNKQTEHYDNKPLYQPIGKVTIDSQDSVNTFSYVSSQTNTVTTMENVPKVSGSLKDFTDYSGKLNIDIYNPSNYIYLFTPTSTECQVIKSLLSDCENYGIQWNSEKKWYEFKYQMCLWASDCGHGNDKRQYIIRLVNNSENRIAKLAMGDLDWFDDDGKLKSKEYDGDNGVKKYFDGCVLCGHRGTENHSQFKTGTNYILNTAIGDHNDIAKEENFGLDFWSNGFFINYVPNSFEPNGSKYFLDNCTDSPFRYNAQIGFKDDNGLHLFNCFLPWYNEDVYQFSTDTNHKYVSADFIVSWMLQTFYLSSETEQRIIDAFQDLIYRKGQIMFTQDVVYKATLETNNLVTIQGFDYVEYKKAVIKNIPKDTLKSDDINVDIQFNSIQKTLPIQLNLNYQTPTVPSSNTSYIINSELYSADETSSWNTSQVTTGKLYQLNDNKLVNLGNNQQVYDVTITWDNTNNAIVYTKSTSSSTRTMLNALKYENGTLVGKNTSAQGRNTYSIKTTANKHSQSCTICDLSLSETLAVVTDVQTRLSTQVQ